MIGGGSIGGIAAVFAGARRRARRPGADRPAAQAVAWDSYFAGVRSAPAIQEIEPGRWVV